MERAEIEFQGKKEPHVILNPNDISNLLVVLDVQLKVINQTPPWNCEKSKQGAIQINEWLHKLVKLTQNAN